MATELSPEQKQAVTMRPDGPIEVVDPTTHREYVLLSAELFARLSASEQDASREMESHLAQLAPEDWEDAGNYDETAP
jgi:hypothetical protein